MKNLCILFLFVLSIGVNSCDKDQSFKPSLKLEEYVLVNFNGVERIYHTDESSDMGVFTNINANIYNFDDGRKEFNLLFTGEPQTYSSCYLRIDKSEVGTYANENLRFNFLDYSLTNAFEMMQTSCTEFECLGEMTVTIHTFGNVGEKVIGEFSGAVMNHLGETNTFDAEFVVTLDN